MRRTGIRSMRLFTQSERGSHLTLPWRKPDSNHWSREGARCPRVVVLVHADFSAGANATDKSDLESLRRVGPMVQIRLPPAPLCCEPGRKPGVGPLAFRDYVWRGSASYATQKAADSSLGRSAPGRQWKLLNINVSESILSPSVPISLHARRSPSAAGQLDRESKWQSFRFVTAYAATQY